ncbi:TetR/AcrR family transcriptional regulator [Rhodococcus sp. EPR-147]|uniref:TetR/AcrR family transcriptional regulator n=3 Tax=unclassified Rhodococcus (in: high G+C Gram-positive bacteria) TaxID=192944 RepID=UPI0018D36AB3|nr:TetR/AcrR family transcriptional regulator [Rhodococcus sp. EPR-147]
MTADAAGTNQWRRPAGRSGPQRDPDRDKRILDAAMTLMIDGGFPGLTMDKVAGAAGVGKATVYRRWASPAVLAAEAFDRAGVVNEAAVTELGQGHLREELLRTLVDTARCSADDQYSDIVQTMFETTRTHPEVSQAVQQRYVDSLNDCVMAVLSNAARRGDISPQRMRRLGPRPVPIAAAITLLVHWKTMYGHGLNREHIETIVDELLLPIFER